MHNCDNITCQLLNPSLERLLTYRDLMKRVTKVEENFFEEIKHTDKSNRHTSFPIDLWGWCNRHMVYQLRNIEFVQELAKVIKDVDPETILEVGAGRGIISRYISKIINKEIILTDDYSWWARWEREEIDEKIEYPDIVKMDYNDAIEIYKPDLIVASWIPHGQCWTEDFRKYPFVKGYIIIGELSCTGSEKDWINDWTAHTLDDVEKYAICRTDHSFCSEIGPMFHTNATYFERPLGPGNL